MLPLLAALLAQTALTAVRESVPADTLRVYLVRHGQALSNLKPTGGEPEAALDHLTPLGREQSREAGGALRGAAALVVASPAGRARESASELAAGAGNLPVRIDERLRPMALGEGSDGKPLPWPRRLEEWAAGRDPVPPRGESFQQVGQRVQAVIDDLRGQGAGRGVVLVAHSEVIGAFLWGLRPPGPGRVLDRLDNGGVTMVDVKAGSPAVVAFVNHLPAELVPPK